MAFSAQGGSQSAFPFLPGSLIGARLGFSGHRRASDPFTASLASRPSSSSPTAHSRSPETQQWQSPFGVTAAKTTMAGMKTAADASQGFASNQALAYLRTASLPHVPTQPQLAAGLMHVETPAMSNPRKLLPVMHT